MTEANEKPDQGRPGVLPEIRCEDQYSALYEDDAIWQPAVREIAACHGLEGDPERLTRGTHLVYGIGGVVLKIYCPLWAASFEAERVALESVDNLPVPRVVAQGRIGEWPYLVQSRAVGVPAQSIWRKLSKGRAQEPCRRDRRPPALPARSSPPEGSRLRLGVLLAGSTLGGRGTPRCPRSVGPLDPIPSRRVRRTAFAPRLPARRLDGGSYSAHQTRRRFLVCLRDRRLWRRPHRSSLLRLHRRHCPLHPG